MKKTGLIILITAVALFFVSTALAAIVFVKNDATIDTQTFATEEDAVYPKETSVLSQFDNMDMLKYDMKEEEFEVKTSSGELFATYSIEYPYFNEDSAVSKVINDYFAELINEYKGRYLNNTLIDAQYEELVGNNINNAEEYAYFSDNIITSVTYNKNGYVSFRIENSNSTGGKIDHSMVCKTYRLSDCKEMSLSNFIIGNENQIDKIFSYYVADKKLTSEVVHYVNELKKGATYVLDDGGLCLYIDMGSSVKMLEITIPYTDDELPIVSAEKILKVIEEKAPILTKENAQMIWETANEVYCNWLVWREDNGYLDIINPIRLYDEVAGQENRYYRVVYNNIKTIPELKNYLSDYFDDAICSQLIDFAGYKEFENELYCRELYLGDDLSTYKGVELIAQTGEDATINLKRGNCQSEGVDLDKLTLKYISGRWIFTGKFICCYGINMSDN